MAAKPWDDKGPEVAKLCLIWPDTNTYPTLTDVAAALGTERSASAVGGKADRLQLPRYRSSNPPVREEAIRQKPKTPAQPVTPPPTPQFTQASKREPEIAPCKDAWRTPIFRSSEAKVSTCAWPIGDPKTKDFCFCDVPSERGLPYCEEHVKVAFTKAPKKEAA